MGYILTSRPVGLTELYHASGRPTGALQGEPLNPPGLAEWEGRNLVILRDLPGAVRKSIGVQVHKAIADRIPEALAEAHARWPYPILEIGGYNNRLKQGAAVLSTHAFGFAFDINPKANRFGSRDFEMPLEFAQALEACGFRWLGRVGGKRIDAMHFQFVEGY